MSFTLCPLCGQRNDTTGHTCWVQTIAPTAWNNHHEIRTDNATIVEDAALVADENKRLKKIAEAAVRYLTHQDYDGLLNALRAEGYLVQQEDSK